MGCSVAVPRAWCQARGMLEDAHQTGCRRAPQPARPIGPNRSGFSTYNSTHVHMSLSPGVRFGNYEIASLLGTGGVGEVYRARDTKLNRDVALKILPELFASDPDRPARFEREAQLLAALNHPHSGDLRLRGDSDDQGDRPRAGRGSDARRSHRGGPVAARRGARDRAANRRGAATLRHRLLTPLTFDPSADTAPGRRTVASCSTWFSAAEARPRR